MLHDEDDAETIDRKGREECAELRKWILQPGLSLRDRKKRASRAVDEVARRMRRSWNSHRIWEYKVRAKGMGVPDESVRRMPRMRDVAIYRLFGRE